MTRTCVSLWVLALACGDSGGEPDGGEDVSFDMCAPGDPSCGGRCRFESFFEGEPTDANLTQYEPGGDAEYEWGFQGGVMILPVITVPPELATGGCVSVTTEHRPDPMYPDNAGEVEIYRGDTFATELICDGSGCQTEPLFNVVGVNAPDGVRMILDVTVRGADWATHTELPLRIVDENGFDECDALTRESDAFGVCTFVRVNGMARIDAISESTVCEDRVELTMTLDAESTLPRECGVVLTHTLEVDAGCLADAEVGDAAASSWRIPDDPECDSPATADPTMLFPLGETALEGCCD